jgi:hypothetical protein
MTTVVVHYPIKKLLPQLMAILLYPDPRNTGAMKGKTIRLRYPAGKQSAAITLIQNGTMLRAELSLFRAISGQNAFTLHSIRKAVLKAFDFVARKIRQEFHCETVELDDSRDIMLSSVDLVRHYRIGAPRDVSALLDAIHRTVKRNGNRVCKPVYRGAACETVEIDLAEFHMKVKFYDKYRETSQPGRRLPKSIIDRKGLRNWLKGCVRMEITVRLDALRERNLTRLGNWTAKARKAIFAAVLSALNLRGRFRVSINDSIFNRLPRRLREPYLCWKLGYDCAGRGRSTAARHKRELLRGYQIDVTKDPEYDSASYMRIRDAFQRDRLVRATKRQIRTWLPEWNTPIGADGTNQRAEALLNDESDVAVNELSETV